MLYPLSYEGTRAGAVENVEENPPTSSIRCMILAKETRWALDEPSSEGRSACSEGFARLWERIEVQAASANDLRLR